MLPIKAFTIENFKSFGPAQKLPLSRINFLFGPNSHGKSSSLLALGILKNALLNKQFNLEEIEHVDNSPSIKINEGLINTSVEDNTFALSSIMPIKVGDKLRDIELYFKLKNLKDSNIEEFKLYEINDGEKKLIVRIHPGGAEANFSSRLFHEKIFNKSPIDIYPGTDEAGGTSLLYEAYNLDNVSLNLDALTELPDIERGTGLTLQGIMNQDDDESKYPINPESFAQARLITVLIKTVFNFFTLYLNSEISWIGPSRFISDNMFIRNGVIDYIKPDYLNHRAIKSLNDWLNTTDTIDLDYEFVLNDLHIGNKNSKHKLELQEFGVRQKGKQEILGLSDVGSGIAHIFQILLTLFNSPSIVIIQQPEIHLHPSLQVQLARAVIELSEKKNVQVFIETHSEHFIKAAQLEIAKGLSAVKPVLDEEDLSILYISKNTDGFSTVRKMELDETGAFTEPWPDDFFELSADLSLERLRQSIKARN